VRDGDGERAITHRPRVDEQAQAAGARTRRFGARQVSFHAQRTAFTDARCERLVFEQLFHALLARPDTQELTDPAPVSHEGEGDIRTRKSGVLDDLGDVAGLRRARTQELAARRDVEEEVVDLHARPGAHTERTQYRRAAAFDQHLQACVGVSRTGAQAEAADRGDAR
jgi:hypothetical protein